MSWGPVPASGGGPPPPPPPPLVWGRGWTNGRHGGVGSPAIDGASCRLPRRGCGGHKVLGSGSCPRSAPPHPPPPRQFVVDARRPHGWRRAFLPAGLYSCWRAGVARFSSTCRYLSPAGPSERAQFVFLFLSPLFFFSGCAATVRPTGAVIDRAPTTRPLYAPATASRALHSRPDPPPSPLFFFVFVAPAPYHAVLALLALLHLPPTPCPRVHSSLLAPSPP